MPRLLLICSLICTLLTSGCSSISHEERLAQATLHAFMQARLARNDTRVRTFLASAYHRQYADAANPTLIGSNEPHYHRYRLLSVQQNSAGSWTGTVRIEVHARGFYPIGWFTEEIDLAPMNGEFQVTRVTKRATQLYTDVAR